MFLKQRYSTVTVDNWFYDELHPVWDNLNTPEKENRKEIIIKAFKKAQEFLTSNLGENMEDWQWGKLHYLQLNHLFGKKKTPTSTVSATSTSQPADPNTTIVKLRETIANQEKR